MVGICTDWFLDTFNIISGWALKTWFLIIFSFFVQIQTHQIQSICITVTFNIFALASSSSEAKQNNKTAFFHSRVQCIYPNHSNHLKPE